MPDETNLFEAGKVLIYTNGERVSAENSSTGAELPDGSVMYVGAGASARETHLGLYDEESGPQAGGKMFVDSGGIIAGIDVQSGGSLSANGAISSGNDAWYGAAICGTGGTIELIGGTFSENRANESNGYNGLGGAIETWGGTLSADGTVFSQNSATGSGSAGGAICAIFTETSLENTTFEQNKAFFGGAFQQQGGRAEISGCVFSGNSASYTDLGLGGALEFHQGAVATISTTQFNANTAKEGGAIYIDIFNNAVSKISVSGGTFSGNTAILHGGAIYNEAELSISSALFENNSAGADESGNGTDTSGEDKLSGGALFNTGNGRVSISGGKFSGNRSASGGAIANCTPDTASGEPVLTVKDSFFKGNEAYGNHTGGGALFQLQKDAETVLKVRNSRFENNRATHSAGGAICSMYGFLDVAAECFFSGNNAGSNGGAIAFHSGGMVKDCVFTANSAGSNGGAIFSAGEALLISGCVFSGNSAQSGGALWNTSTMPVTVEHCVFSGNNAENGGAILNEAEMSISNTVFSTESDTLLNRGTLRFSGSNRIGGKVVNNGSIEMEIAAENATSGAGTPLALVDFLENFSGGQLAISIESALEDGSYRVAAHTGNFTGSLALTINGKISNSFFSLQQGKTAPDNVIFLDGKYCTLRTEKDSDSLTLDVTSTGQVSSKNKITWNDFSGAAGYEVEFSRDSNFFGILSIRTDGTAFNLNNLPEGTYQWRVRSTDSDVWAQGEAISVEKNRAQKAFVPEQDGIADIFFAKASGVWNSSFNAVHAHTGEKVKTAGKNHFQDVFTGSGDANILYLTDTPNGDALFQDDIYSLGGGNGRLNNIREIRAGGGNDIIDLTSRKIRSGLSGVTLRGGEGDDILWASDAETKLFGDEGNDTLRGGEGNDLLCGGSGDDILFGGGGNDLFTFGGIWGNDEVGQDPSGHVVLLFEEGASLNPWKDSDTVLTNGLSSITLLDGLTAGDVTILTGAVPDGMEEYDSLAARGAFLGFSSGTVFEHNPAPGVFPKL